MSTIFSTHVPVPKVSNAVIDVIYHRRATRKYRDKQIDKDTIDELIEAGKMAPSAINRQPYRLIIADDPELIRAFSEAIAKEAGMLFRLAMGVRYHEHTDPIFYHAPVVIFFAGPEEDEWAGLDIGMCAQNVMLAAKSLGLDSCPVGFAKLVEKTEMLPKLKLDADEKVYLAVAIGYGDEKPEFHGRKKDNVVFLKK